MPNLTDILGDKTKYPDEQKITLADGVETTVGELRGGFLRQQDYSRKTADVAREREAMTRERAEFDTAKASAEAELTGLAERIVSQRTTVGKSTTRDELDDLMDRDPLARRLRDDIQGLRQQHTEVVDAIKQQQETLKQQQLAFVADQHRRALTVLRQRDPDLDTDELIRFAQDNGIPRLDLAHRLLTEDKRFETAIKTKTEEASKAAYEKAKRELAAPAIPSSRRVAGPPPADAPKDFDEAADRAKSDPEILEIMGGWTG